MFRAAPARIYTVHERTEAAEPSDRVVLVREGFLFWAFLFNGFWLLYQRLWIPFFIYLALVIYVVEGGAHIGLPEATIAVAQVGLQLLLGFSAQDIRRWALARKGYVIRGVVIGDSELHAEQRAYDRLAA